MGKYDDFFSVKVPDAVSKRILEHTEAEIQNLKRKDRKSKLLGVFAPFSTVAAVIILVIYFNFGSIMQKNSDAESANMVAMAMLGNELVGHLMEEESLEMVGDLGVIEDFETLVELSDVDLEG